MGICFEKCRLSNSIVGCIFICYLERSISSKNGLQALVFRKVYCELGFLLVAGLARETSSRIPNKLWSRGKVLVLENRSSPIVDLNSLMR